MAKRFTVKPKAVTAAEDATPEESFIDSLDAIKDDFDFALDGLAKITQDGFRGDAEEISGRLAAAINSAIEETSSILAQ